MTMTITRRRLIELGAGLACMAGLPAHAAPERPKEIRIGDSKGDWGLPTPWRHYPRGPGYLRMSWIFETLLWKDERGPVPALAESWSWDEKTLSYTFRIRKGVKWHDGRPLAADDCAFTILYMKKHPYSWAKLGLVADASAPDAQTLVVKMKKAFAPFPDVVAGTMPIIPKHVWETVEDPKAFVEPAAFTGTGPFRFKAFDKVKGTYLYEANDAWWAGRPAAERLIYVKTQKPLAALTTGEADLAIIKPEMRAQAEKAGCTVITEAGGWMKKLLVNHRSALLSDKRMRQAIALSIDVDELIAKSLRGHAVRASSGFLPPDHPKAAKDLPVYRPDPARAEALLAELGWRRNAGGRFERNGEPLKLRLIVSNITAGGDQTRDRDGKILRVQLEKAGFTVEARNLETAAADNLIVKWDFDLAVSGHGGVAGDAMSLADYLGPDVAAGYASGARFGANDELNRLLVAQISETDPERRTAMVRRIQEIHADELPCIPLYHPVAMSAYRTSCGIKWFYTPGGVSGRGIPIPQNRLALLAR